MNGDRLIRWTAVSAVLTVAVIAAYVSYWHAVSVVADHGETGVRGHLYPIGIDGLIIAASMVVLDAARHVEAAPKLAWCLLAAGIAVTMAANVSYGVAFGVSGALWAAWPALAFVGSYELLMTLVRASARRAPAAAGTVPAGDEIVPLDAESAAAMAYRATVHAGNALSQNQLIERFQLTRTQATKVRRVIDSEPNGHHVPDD